MNRYVDMHSHILPGIDDGPSTWEESLKMLQMAQDEGIGVIVATPHCGLFNQDYDIEHARELVAEFNRKSAELGIGTRIILGNELYYLPGIVNSVIAGKAATMAGSDYVLVEFSVNVTVNTVEQAVKEFTTAGYRPIIAHVERYQQIFDKNLASIRNIRRMGAYYQVNTSSLTDKRRRVPLGKKNDKTDRAIELLSEGMVDLVATDAHNVKHRAPLMKDAAALMSLIIGRGRTHDILYSNTRAVLENEFI